MTKPTPIVISADQAQPFELLGNTLTVRIASGQTGGAFSVVEFAVAPGFVAPPLFHRNTREDWWGQVLEGEIAIEPEGEPTRIVAAGAWVFSPKNSSFRWWNPSPKPARWLLTYAPGGFEQYFIEGAKVVAEKKPKTPQEVGALAMPLWAKYGVVTTMPQAPR